MIVFICGFICFLSFEALDAHLSLPVGLFARKWFQKFRSPLPWFPLFYPKDLHAHGREPRQRLTRATRRDPFLLSPLLSADNAAVGHPGAPLGQFFHGRSDTET
jgi:hypothetical protein